MWTGDSLFLGNGEENQNIPLKDFTKTKIGYKKHRRGRMDSWSNLVWMYMNNSWIEVSNSLRVPSSKILREEDQVGLYE